MAVEVIEWVFNHSCSKNGARLTLLAIADACHFADGTGAWPSVAELKRKTQLSERAIHDGIAVLAKLGELWVGLNQGPGGCNRYEVLMISADSAPLQNLHPAESAGVHAPESQQVTPQTPAESAPPADTAPPQNLHLPPAESAPGTVIEPSVEEVVTTTSPATRRRGAKRPPADAVAPRFDDFWAVYPKRKDKGQAEKAWTKAINAGADPQVVIDAAFEYAQRRKGQDPQWTKQPATWLNARCWEDEPDPVYSPAEMLPGFPVANGNGYAPRPSTTDQRVAEGLRLAEYYRARGE